MKKVARKETVEADDEGFKPATKGSKLKQREGKENTTTLNSFEVLAEMME